MEGFGFEVIASTILDVYKARLLTPSRRILRRIAGAPEPNVALFAFLLNYPWEFLQSPFFQGMANALHWEAVKMCTQAALGDVAIMVIAFWGAAAAVRSRSWVLNPTRRSFLVFIAIGLAIMAVLERLDRWVYAETMPIVPLLGIGLFPFLQWILLPPLVVWFVRRQLS